jgi:hypothetical protein
MILSDQLYNRKRYGEMSLAEAAKSLFEERTMSMSDYRRGVEDATKPLNLNPLTGHSASEIDEIVAERRKALLTRKVTKWVNIYQDGNVIQTGYKSLYDSKEDAALFTKYPDYGFKYIGTYPIEIETPA